MKISSLWSLFLVCLVLLAVPLEAKKLSPSYFGGVYVQTSFAIATSLLLSAGIFLSLKLLFESRQSFKRAFLAFMVFLITYTAILSFYLWVDHAFVIFRTLSSDVVSESTLAPMIKKLYNNATAAKTRGNMAIAIYRLHGISVPFKSEDGNLAYYQPTSGDVDQWNKSKTMKETAGQTLQLIDSTISQLHRLILFYLVSLFSVLIIGTVTTVIQKQLNTTKQLPE